MTVAGLLKSHVRCYMYPPLIDPRHRSVDACVNGTTQFLLRDKSNAITLPHSHALLHSRGGCRTDVRPERYRDRARRNGVAGKGCLPVVWLHAKPLIQHCDWDLPPVPGRVHLTEQLVKFLSRPADLLFTQPSFGVNAYILRVELLRTGEQRADVALAAVGSPETDPVALGAGHQQRAHDLMRFNRVAKNITRAQFRAERALIACTVPDPGILLFGSPFSFNQRMVRRKHDQPADRSGHGQ